MAFKQQTSTQGRKQRRLASPQRVEVAGMKYVWKTGFTAWAEQKTEGPWGHKGSFHRETAPAVLTAGGTSEWYLNDDPQRKDDNACTILYPDGHTDKPRRS